MILSLLFCLGAFAADLRLNELEPKLDAFVKDFQPVENTGIAVGIVKDGELVFFKGYGYRDREKKLPVTQHTVFAIGSVTKMFVSTSLAILQEEGRVDFSTPVKNYLPGFALENSIATEQASLNDLLSHQTGLPRHDYLWYFTPFTPQELFGKLPLLETDKREGMGFRSGRMQYNNLMYITSGLLIRKLSGQPWQEFVRDRLTGPLGMKATTFDLSGFDSEDAALPYLAAERLPYKPLNSAGAAGSINSNVADMAKWVGFHLAKGKGLVSPEALSALYQKHSDSSNPAMGIESGYGLGTMLASVGGKTVIYHGGNIDGFTAHASFMPETGIGLVVLVNQNGAGNFEYPFSVEEEKGKPPIPLFPYIVYDHFLKNSGSDAGAVTRGALNEFSAAFERPLGGQAQDFIETVQLATASPFYFGGNYADLAYGNLSVVTKADLSLSLNYYGTLFDLMPTENPNLFWVGVDGVKSVISVEFETVGNDVAAVKVLFEPAVKPIRFIRSK
jgi:CubicO group peptidase (beta-lactamase class C family)